MGGDIFLHVHCEKWIPNIKNAYLQDMKKWCIITLSIKKVKKRRVSMSNLSNTSTIKAPKSTFWEKLNRQKYLQMMVWPGIIWMFVFNYIPMGGIMIAFRDYKITRGIFEGDWVGFEYFVEFLTDPSFANVMRRKLRYLCSNAEYK